MAANEIERGGTGRAPVHLWIVGVLALLWNLMGIFDYLATQLRLDFYMSQFSEAQLTYFYGLPAWTTAAWAFGVWGALAGSIGLLLRKCWCVWAFGLSLAGLFFSSVYSFALSNGAEAMGTTGLIMTAIIWPVAIFLLLYSMRQCKNGVFA